MLKLDPPRIFFICALSLLTLFYPGQNDIQKIVINQGTVKAYTLPTIIPSIYPVSDGTHPPSLSARSIVVQDIGSKAIIYSKNPDMLMMPASITKVMTALVALDHWINLDAIIEVKTEDRAIGQTIELKKGEKITVRNLLYGLLVHSGNDAALAIADNYPGGYDAFVKAMNQKAKDLHLDHTTFKNPSGVEQYNHTTTSRDIVILSTYAINNPTISKIVSTKSITVTDESGKIVHILDTTNELLGVIPGLKGLKTGWTTNAGECLVSYIVRDDHKVVVVVLGSQDRFGESKALIDWTFAHHNWITPVL